MFSCVRFLSRLEKNHIIFRLIETAFLVLSLVFELFVYFQDILFSLYVWTCTSIVSFVLFDFPLFGGERLATSWNKLLVVVVIQPLPRCYLLIWTFSSQCGFVVFISQSIEFFEYLCHNCHECKIWNVRWHEMNLIFINTEFC